MSLETFAARFKEAREKKNITIKALQPLVGASPSALNGYATGKTQPPLDVAMKIAKELDVSLDWLCGMETNTHNQFSIDTAGDYLRILSLLLTTKIIDAPTRTTPTTTYVGGSVFGAYITEHDSIEIQNERVPGYHLNFSNWKKLIELYQKGEIDQEVYAAWIEKKIESLSQYQLPYSPKFYNGPIDIEEFPF